MLSSRVTPQMHAALAGKMLSLLSVNGGLYRGPIPPTGDTTLRFRLGPPEPTGMDVTDILFLVRPDRIVITGDSHPFLRGPTGGVVSNPGYGVGWFGRRQGERYLAEQFLHESYYPVTGLEWLEGWVKDVRAGENNATAEQVEKAEDVLLRAGRPDHDNEKFVPELQTYEGFYQFLMNDLGFSSLENEGIDYDPDHLCWLAGIQDRFSVLYSAMFSGTMQEQKAAADYSFWVQYPRTESEAPFAARSEATSLAACSHTFLRSLPPKAPHVADELRRRAGKVAS